MPRVTGRDPAVVEEVLFEAFARAARDHVIGADGDQPVLAVPVKNLLREVSEKYRDDPRGISPVTTGFIQAQYGGKQGFVDAALVHMLGPEGLDARRIIVRAAVGLLAGDPRQVRNETVRMDLVNMMASEETARIWMLHIAYSRRPNVGAVTRDVYALFERAHRVLLELELAMRDRRLSEGRTLEELALGHTAIAEGIMIRLLGDARIDDESRARLIGTQDSPGLAGIWCNAVLESMTEPVATPRTGLPIVLVRSLIEMASDLPDDELMADIVAVSALDVPAVMLFLGLVREQQGNVEGDPGGDDAAGWWRRAAAGGDVDAHRLLGTLRHSQGRLQGDPSGDDAEGWWQRAAELGDPAATTNMGVIRATQGRIGGDPVGDDAAGWWQRAVQLGEPSSLINLGWLRHQEGRETADPDGDDAQTWWERAAGIQHGYLESMLDPGLLWHARELPDRAEADASRPITVAVVDQHEAVREGVAARLGAAADIEVVASVASIDDLLTADVVADVTLLDTWPDDVLLARAVEQRVGSGQAVLLYTNDERPMPLRLAIAFGASGVLLKSDSLEALVEGIRSVAAGDFFCSRAMAEAMLTAPLAMAALSGRQIQALAILSDGHTVQETARRLGVSDQTVREHLRRARVRLLAIGMERGNSHDLTRLAPD